ncbi:hypothetical protein K458DRAFT_295682 [Lentithecium fluviatile CBS 122367]|uniref:Asteroid domain-containing protein n=1 Tax=Lentithecium fluviatile CBS 122367 TaxID=1168545 RepID=A0A6G1JAV1_9PLEO|nr:hypothetical protein K458DRAFT_295682 [Lentithecium fluviatile CBS 122367]
MGIAGLARRLDPYASRYTPEELGGCHAIVDGPSLAYHAYELAHAVSSNQSRLPSYADINAQAIRWLKALEDVDIKVSAILFDGALPDTKRNERLSRLQSNNQRVRQFRINYPTAACPIPTQLGSAPFSLLAPGLREALGDSKYASVTRIVPGEADDSCASCANQYPRSIIFSNDTDLILYDYPAEGRVLFLRDVELWPEPKFKGYSPTKIQQALHLTSLVPWAYCITQDPREPFSASVKAARDVDTASSQYEEFSKRYTIPSVAPLENSRMESALQNLDVRVSEFVYQALDVALVPKVYLPLLVEDPNQASAWNVGHGLRLLACSLLAPDREVLHEYKRKAQGIAMHEVKLHSPKELSLSAEALSRDISAWLRWTGDRQVPREFIWPLIAVNIVLPEMTTSPKMTLVIRVVNGDFDNTWDFVHLTARMHAALYSLRFLKQCVTLWLAVNEDSSVELHRPVDNLHRTLQGMPAIAELFIVPGQAGRPLGDSTILQTLINEIYTSANVEILDEQISNKKLKKQKREAERKAKKKQQEASTQRTQNLSELLNQRQ